MVRLLQSYCRLTVGVMKNNKKLNLEKLTSAYLQMMVKKFARLGATSI